MTHHTDFIMLYFLVGIDLGFVMLIYRSLLNHVHVAMPVLRYYVFMEIKKFHQRFLKCCKEKISLEGSYVKRGLIQLILVVYKVHFLINVL